MASQYWPKRTRLDLQPANAAPPPLPEPHDTFSLPASPLPAVDDIYIEQDGTREESVHPSTSARLDELGGTDKDNSDVRLVAAAVPFSTDHFFNAAWVHDQSGVRERYDDGSPNSLVLGTRAAAQTKPSVGKSTHPNVSRRCVGWMAAATVLALVIALVALGLIAVTRDTNRSNNNSGNKSGSTAASSEALAIRVAELKVMVAQLQVAAAAATASKSELLRISQLEAVVAQLQAELNGATEAVTHLLAASVKRHAQVGNITSAIATPPEVPGMLTDVATTCGISDHFYMTTTGHVVCKRDIVLKKKITYDSAMLYDFATSVATRDRIIAVGAWTGDNQHRVGIVYLYQRGSNFTLQGFNNIVATGENDFFGSTVALGTDGLIVVGAHGSWFETTGAAYVYRVSTNSAPHTLLAKLLPDEGSISFGEWVATGPNGLVVIAAPDDSVNGHSSGSVYLYRINTTLGAEAQPRLLAKILPADGVVDSQFGSSIAVGGPSDSLLLVGAQSDVNGGIAAGSAYVFRLEGDETPPQLVTKIVQYDAVAGDHFGCSVAVEPSGLLAVGASWRATDMGVIEAGAAYLYRLTASKSAKLVTKLVAEDAAHQGFFGSSLAFSDHGLLVVGSPGYGPRSGSAYFYRVSTIADTPPLLITRVTDSTSASDMFGQAVAVDSNGGVVVVVGFPDMLRKTRAVYFYA